jgi:hypothetical protein
MSTARRDSSERRILKVIHQKVIHSQPRHFSALGSRVIAKANANFRPVNRQIQILLFGNSIGNSGQLIASQIMKNFTFIFRFTG